MRTAADCRARAAALVELASQAADPMLARQLLETAADWTTIAATVSLMEAWEDRFIGEITPGPPAGSLLD
jgi:hypothetical protein